MANDVRHICGFGPRLLGTSANTLTRSSSFFDDKWTQYHSAIIALNPTAYDGFVKPIISFGNKWKAFYVNESQAPVNQTQAQDPSWSNYLWNEPPAAGMTNDPLGTALNSTHVQNGAGIGRVNYQVAVSASAQNAPLPAWFKAIPNSHCVSSNGHEHINYNDQSMVQHAVDFLIAFCKRYAANEGLHSIDLGEYFTQGCPTSPNYGRNASVFVWDQLLPHFTTGSDGKRVMLGQISPIYDTAPGNFSDVTLQEAQDRCIKYAQTDIHFDFPVCVDVGLTCDTKTAFDAGFQHVHSRGDYQKILWQCSPAEHSAGQNRREDWTQAPANEPNKSGASERLEFRDYLWYHSKNGHVPVDTITFSEGYATCTAPYWQNQIIPYSARWLNGGDLEATWGPVVSDRRHGLIVNPNQTIPLTYAGQARYEA